MMNKKATNNNYQKVLKYFLLLYSGIQIVAILAANIYLLNGLIKNEASMLSSAIFLFVVAIILLIWSVFNFKIIINNLIKARGSVIAAALSQLAVGIGFLTGEYANIMMGSIIIVLSVLAIFSVVLFIASSQKKSNNI